MISICYILQQFVIVLCFFKLEPNLVIHINENSLRTTETDLCKKSKTMFLDQKACLVFNNKYQ